MNNVELLTPQERDWAFELDEAIYGTDENNNNNKTKKPLKRSVRRGIVSRRFLSVGAINNNGNGGGPPPRGTQLYGRPSDLEIASHAIRAKGDTQRALKRLSRIKAFKDSYGIPEFDFDDETKQIENSVLQLMKKVFFTAYPTFLQKIGLDRAGRLTVLLRLDGLRWTKNPPFNHTEEERWRAMYYLLHATQPTVHSIRTGTVWICDCEFIEERPGPEIFRGFRSLLRDSYPIKVEDVPVVDCPPRFSRCFATTYPFFSRHFASKFVRVTPAQLCKHFPHEMLTPRLLLANYVGGGGNNGENNNNQNKNNGSGSVNLFDENDNNKNNQGGGNRRRSDSAKDEEDWECLDESFREEGPNNDNTGEVIIETSNRSTEEDAFNDDHFDKELWTKLERLLMMRFHTERKFRLM